MVYSTLNLDYTEQRRVQLRESDINSGISCMYGYGIFDTDSIDEMMTECYDIINKIKNIFMEKLTEYDKYMHHPNMTIGYLGNDAYAIMYDFLIKYHSCKVELKIMYKPHKDTFTIEIQPRGRENTYLQDEILQLIEESICDQ